MEQEIRRGLGMERRDSSSVEFMLAEFSLLGELWRHTDARIETAMNFYLTTAAILVPGTLLVYQSFASVRLLIGASILVSIILAAMGVFILSRVTRAHEIKQEYAHAANLIRLYFVETDQNLAAYIHLPIAGRTAAKVTRVNLLPSLVKVVRAINCMALGWALGAVLWLSGVLRIPAAILVGVTSAVAGFIALHTLKKLPEIGSHWGRAQEVLDKSEKVGA